MKTWQKALSGAAMVGALIGGAVVPAQAVTVYATPWVKDAPGGKWEKTCRYDEQRLANGRTRLHEVRQSNAGTLWKPCLRTGYYVDAPTNGTARVIWWY